MLSQLPSAFFAGLRIANLSTESAAITVRYKWFNKNPFRSMYMGILTMAAEISTGLLCMGALYKRNPAVSMLVVKNEAAYSKKAVGKITFTCNDGVAANAAVEKAIETGEGTTVDCLTIGKDEAGDEVARFIFTWSFKARAKK